MEQDLCFFQQFEDGSGALSVEFSKKLEFQRRQFSASVARVDSGEESFAYLFRDSEPSVQLLATEWALQVGSVQDTTRLTKPVGSTDYLKKYGLVTVTVVAVVCGLAIARTLLRKLPTMVRAKAPEVQPEAPPEEYRHDYDEYDQTSSMLMDKWRSEDYFMQYDAPWANPLYQEGSYWTAEIEMQDISSHEGRCETRMNPMLEAMQNAEYTY